MILKERQKGEFKKTEIESFSLIKKEGQKKERKKGLIEVDDEKIRKVLEKTAVIVPTKDENLEILEMVLRSIPEVRATIVISNSKQEWPFDFFAKEESLVKQLNKILSYPVVICHQKNWKISQIFSLRYPYILDPKRNEIKNGKAEGCIIATAIAEIFKPEYICFIDADNLAPATVDEYVKCFAAGFCLSKTKNTNVRLVWRKKGKIGKTISLYDVGRVSKITNKILSKMMEDFGKKLMIESGNAGEEAFSVNFLYNLCWAPRFGMETQFLLEALFFNQNAKLIEMKTISPHFHTERKEKGHIKEMIQESLSVIYHRPEVPKATKRLIEEISKKLKIRLLSQRKYPAYPPLIASIESLKKDLEELEEIINFLR